MRDTYGSPPEFFCETNCEKDHSQSNQSSHEWILKDDAYVGCLMKQAKIDNAKIVGVGGICDGKML